MEGALNVNKSFLMGRLIILALLSFCLATASAQEMNKWSDSIAVSFLNKQGFGESIGVKKDTINGKVKVGRDYYCYMSFRLQLHDSSTVFLMNFGAYDSEGKNYIMVVDKLANKKFFFFLGENSFEEDLNKLSTYFKSKGKELKEKYKLEICDLFLRSRRGQIETPKYIH